EVWNVSDPAHPRQVNFTYRDREQANSATIFKSWNDAARIYAIVVNSDYDPNKVITVSAGPNADNALATWVWVFYSTYYHVGDIVDIKYAKPLIPGTDTFRFTAPSAVSYQIDLAKQDVDKINVFPNPYYGVNPREVNKYQRFVTFSHLPQRATLRMFNLAGQLVRIIQKDSPSQFITWDLVNDSSFPVASGLYIVYIDMPDLGQTKTLKLAVIQEQQVLDHF
ncbi:MAG: T9SS C-terminal target domain-containing protein, partial [Ignavibacteriales bacterium]